MSDGSIGQEPPKKGPGPFKLVALFCCGCLFLFAAFIAVVAGIPLLITGPAVDAARRHLSDAGRDPALAYAELAADRKASMTEAEFRGYVTAHPEYYQAADLTFSNRQFVNGKFTISGTATAKDGTQAPIQVELVKEGDAIRVTSVGAPP